MSLNQNQEANESPQFDELATVCPTCEEPIMFDSPTCRHCGFEGMRRHGIPSLTPDAIHRRSNDQRLDSVEPGSQLLEADELARLAARIESGSVRDATTILEGHEHRDDVLNAIYDINRESWLTFVSESISGRCLDVGAGFGRRAHILAELCESVVAVDSNLQKLRIAATRDDYDNGERIIPLHTTEDRIPFDSGTFDTIVADFTGSSVDDVRARLSRLSEYLVDDGTLVFTADGWPSQTGLTELAGLDSSDSGTSRSLSAGTPSAYRSVVDDAGFDALSLYTLFPTASRPLFVFDIEDDRAIETLAEFVLSDRGRLAKTGKPFVSLANRFGLLNRWYPSFLAVCTNQAVSTRSSAAYNDSLLVSGRTRSVVLDIGDRGIDRVWKYPNRLEHSPFTERENAVLSSLHASNEPIVETLPHGQVIESAFGEARTEDPVAGSPLDDDLSADIRSYERVLRLGFDWLIEFQQSFGGPTVTRSPAEVREDLRFAPTDLEPPEIDDPVTTFFTPAHGDYLAGNIHVADDEVTSVIDWEYGAIDASPIIDAGFLVLNAAMRVFGGLDDGFQSVFCDDNEFARITQSMIRGYCRDVGIPVRTFKLYLPSVFLHRLELDWRFDAVSTYTDKIDDRSRVVEYVFDNLSEVYIQ